jgi:hypothetical protein
MNERIKELIAQAGMTLKERQLYDEENYPGYECSDNDHFDDNLSAVRAFFDSGLEKFAELIVRECISKVSEWDMGIDDPVGATDNTSEVARDMVAEIKEHFGVEE